MRRDARRPHARRRRAGLGEQMPHDERRVAHHVVEHAAALQRALPEPRHVRAAVLLGGAREIGTTRRRRAARPEQLAPRLDLRREQLVLEISVRDPGSLHQLGDALRLGHVSRQRLLARDALERSLPALDRVHDLLDVLDARLIRPRQPDRVDRRIGDHVGDRRVRLRVADVERARAVPRPTPRSSRSGSRRRARRRRARREMPACESAR